MEPQIGEFFGGIPLRSYGIFAFIGLALGCWLAYRGATRSGFERRDTIDLLAWTLVSSLIAAKASMILVDLSLNEVEISGGLSALGSDLFMFGGIFGGALTVLLFSRRRGLSSGLAFDAVSPGLMLGHVWGRFGCFLTGCCFGKAGGGPLSVQFGPGSRAFEVHSSLGITAPTENLTHGMHPVQLYEALLCLLLAGVLIFFLIPRRRWAGWATLIALPCYAAGRFVLEIYRGDRARGFLGEPSAAVGLNRWLGVDGGSPTAMSVSQLAALLTLLVCAWIGLLLSGRRSSRSVRNGDGRPDDD